MSLPGVEQAEVPSQKITDYLLDVNHEQGRGKAQFFLHVGFLLERWEVLAQALIRHAQENDIVKTEATRFGIRYIVEGALHTPGGRIVHIRSVWFVSRDAAHPRLVTAYPMEERDDQGT
jgi:hypothetical protein